MIGNVPVSDGLARQQLALKRPASAVALNGSGDGGGAAAVDPMAAILVKLSVLHHVESSSVSVDLAVQTRLEPPHCTS